MHGSRVKINYPSVRLSDRSNEISIASKTVDHCEWIFIYLFFSPFRFPGIGTILNEPCHTYLVATLCRPPVWILSFFFQFKQYSSCRKKKNVLPSSGTNWVYPEEFFFPPHHNGTRTRHLIPLAVTNTKCAYDSPPERWAGA